MIAAALSPVPASAADGIQYSKPEVSFAAPPGKGPELPPGFEGKKSLDFRSGPEPMINFVPPSTAPERLRRQEKKKRTIFDDPAIYSDPDKEKNSESENQSPFARKNEFVMPGAKSSQSGSQDQQRRPDEQRALSPIQQFDWNPEEEKEKEASFLGVFNSSSEKKKEKEKEKDDKEGKWSPLAVQENSFAKPQDLSFGFLNPSTSREWSREQLERRTEFEKLLAPASPALSASESRGSSLDPITSPIEIPKAAPSAAMKTFEPPRSEPAPTFDPVRNQFDQQQRTWRSASFDDVNRRFGNSSPNSSSAVTPVDGSRQQRPLMKQPTMLEFPTRRF